MWSAWELWIEIQNTNWNLICVLGGKKIGIPGVLEAKDIANPNVEYLGVMAWVAQFQWIPDKTPPSERLEMRCNLNKIKVGEEVRLFFFSNLQCFAI